MRDRFMYIRWNTLFYVTKTWWKLGLVTNLEGINMQMESQYKLIRG